MLWHRCGRPRSLALTRILAELAAIWVPCASRFAAQRQRPLVLIQATSTMVRLGELGTAEALSSAEHRSLAPGGPEGGAAAPWGTASGDAQWPLLPDDGSQVSAPGEALTLQDARRLLGSSSDLGLIQRRDNAELRGELDRIAVVYVSGRTDFDDALREAVLQYVPMGSIFKTEGKTPGNFIQALEHSAGAFPNASWYYIADDDSFVNLKRLAEVAEAHDPEHFAYIGHRDCAGTSCNHGPVRCQRTAMQDAKGSPGWACGGPGILISRPLAVAMATRGCSQYYAKEPAPVCCGDMSLSCCAFDAWDGYQIIDEPRFSPYPVEAGLGDKASPAVAIHKIKPNTTRELGKLYNARLLEAGEGQPQ